MEIKKLSKQELMDRFGKLVQTERKITHLVLECIAEIDLRKIYLEKAFPSLFEFLVKEYGYSPSAAVRRIDSARLLREVPEISGKIESGVLNLSQLSKLQHAVRSVQKTEARKVGLEEKRSLLDKIENTSQEQTELILSKELNIPITHEDRKKIHQDESVTLTITFSKEQMALLNQAQDLLSHAVPNGAWADVLVYLAQKEIARKTQIKRPSIAPLQKSQLTGTTDRLQTSQDREMAKHLQTSHDSGTSNHLQTSPMPLKVDKLAPARKSIRPNLRKAILQKDKCFQFRDLQTGKICGSSRFSEVDHIQPVWAGGGNDPENLGILCSQHNKFKYAKESGRHPLRL